MNIQLTQHSKIYQSTRTYLPQHCEHVKVAGYINAHKYLKQKRRTLKFDVIYTNRFN